MIRFVIIFLLGVCFDVSANDISKINKLKKEAELAYKAGKYDEAVVHYSYLIDTLQVEDERATLNFGHAYYQMGNREMAQAQYQKLVLSDDPALKSIAYQQLGALSNDPKTLEKALSYFKESIKSDPSNQDARYNYELVKKKLKKQQEQNQDQQNQDQNKPNEPSDWAKKLKEQADRMVERRQYTQAHQLMNDGISKDPTVQYYADFIKRLGEVSKIDG